MPSPLVYRVNVFLCPNEYLMIYGSGTAPAGEEERRVHSRGYLTTSLCDQKARPEPRTFTVNKISQRTRGDNMSTKRWGATSYASVQFQSNFRATQTQGVHTSDKALFCDSHCQNDGAQTESMGCSTLVKNLETLQVGAVVTHNHCGPVQSQSP